MAKRNGGWGLLHGVGIKNDYLLRVVEELYLRGVAGLDDLPILRFSGFMSSSNLGWQEDPKWCIERTGLHSM